jgi:hypothetical protein
MTLDNGEQMEVMARIRYRQPLQAATLHQFENGMYVKNINLPQRDNLPPGISKMN